MEKYLVKYKNWTYKNTFILILGLSLFFYFADSPFVVNFLSKISSLGYLGALLAGAFFVSVFTVAPAAVIIYELATKLNPYFIAILAGAGAVLGDYMIFRFLKNGVFEEISPLFQKSKGIKKIGQLFTTPYFSWLIPIFGAAWIASPLPDEVGIGMMGISKIKTWQFILVTFILNTTGILILILLANIL